MYFLHFSWHLTFPFSRSTFDHHHLHSFLQETQQLFLIIFFLRGIFIFPLLEPKHRGVSRCTNACIFFTTISYIISSSFSSCIVDSLNRLHDLVWLVGQTTFGRSTYICIWSYSYFPRLHFSFRDNISQLKTSLWDVSEHISLLKIAVAHVNLAHYSTIKRKWSGIINILKTHCHTRIRFV
jgi:hypothetical protein